MDEGGKTMNEKSRARTTRGWAATAVLAFALAACGGGGSGEHQAGDQASPATQDAGGPADPLEGEWLTEFTCRESVRGITRHLSPKEIADQIRSWGEFLEMWEPEPTKKDPCHGASGTFSRLARFVDGNLALCDAETNECEVHATYDLVGPNAISVNDTEGNLCDAKLGCPVKWEFDLAGDQLTFRVSPDAFVIGTWEAAPWIRQS
jgi:hypothetical protein